MSSKTAYTTVINTSGGRELFFSFLPPHGLTLDSFQSITFIGEILDRLIPSWPYHSDKDRPPNRAKVRALQHAEDTGTLLVIRSPEPIIHKVLTTAFHRIDSLGRPDPFFSNQGEQCTS